MVTTVADERTCVPTIPADIDDALVTVQQTASQDDSLSRRQRAEVLLLGAVSRREPLERMRADFQAQLHAGSDDFDASEGLRTVEIALRLVPPTARDDRVRRAQR